MKIQILSIGNEVVCGDVVNTNASWLSTELSKQGFEVVRHVTIPDDEQAIVDALQQTASLQAMIVTGGLGPTVDDFTLEVAAKAFQLPLVQDADVLDRLKSIFRKLGREMTPNQEKQSFIPEGGETLPNEWGTAPGVYLRANRIDYFFLPGVPKEMQSIFQDSVLPLLKRGLDSSSIFVSKTLRCFGAPEARLDHLLKPLLRNRVDIRNAKLAFRLTLPDVLLKVTAWGQTEQEAQHFLNEALEPIREKISDHLYSENGELLEEVVGRKLIEQRKTLAVAESCTGGLIVHRITNIAGSSQYFRGGITAYSNDVKIALLGVDPDTLATHGAVSEQTALEMAKGVRKNLDADLGLSVTGIAGPSGGSEEKPVGTVYLALASLEKIEVKKFFFPFHREWFKLIVSSTGLDWIRRHLSSNHNLSHSNKNLLKKLY